MIEPRLELDSFIALAIRMDLPGVIKLKLKLEFLAQRS